MAGKKPLRKVLFMPIHWAYLIALVVILAVCTYVFYPRVESFRSEERRVGKEC
jgi:hypothetical protein